MSDVDDELLALVGGDSEDESDQPAPSTKKSKSRAQDSDEEEGEASSAPGSPASQDSAPMDESDSDNEVTQSNNSRGNMSYEDSAYPVDQIYTSHAERAKIAALPQLQREMFIADRTAEMDRAKQNTLLRALLKSRDDDQSGRKRKADSDDEDDGSRKTSRQRTKIGGSKAGESSTGIESLRRARAEKNDRQRRREEDRERNKDRSISFAQGSSDREDGDSDVEWGAPGKRTSRSRTPEVKEVPLADLRDIERCRVGRSRFSQVCFFPGFESAIVGCYVRIAIGPDRDGAPCYRMAIIKSFTQGKPYALEKANGQNFITDQYVKVAHGKAEREWPFISCSDSPFNEAEYNRYKSVCQTEGVVFPKKTTLAAKIDDINGLVSRKWTDEEVNDKILRERKLKTKYSGEDRARLQKSLDDARGRGDEKRVSELQEQLDALEATPRLAFKTSLTPTKNKTSSPSISQQDRLAQLNAANRKANAEKVRKAQMMEKAKVREIEARIARGEDVSGDDRSRRLKTVPKFMQDISEDPNKKPSSKPASGASTPSLGATKSNGQLPTSMAKLQLQNQAGKDKNGIPQIHRPISGDDVIAAMDIDIDIDID